MCARKFIVVCAVGAISLMLLGGCLPQQDTRTSNQGGSNIIQASTRFANDQLDKLNPDDIQVLSDLAAQTSGLDIPEVTDEQAAAVIKFLDDNHVATQADLANLDPNTVIISDEVMAVFEALAGNAAAYQSLQ